MYPNNKKRRYGNMAAGVAFKYSCSRYISSPEWASLPLLPVFLILDNLFEPIDHVCFADVCKQWRSLAKDYNQATQRWRHNNLLPMLLIPNEYECQGGSCKNGRLLTKTNHRKALYSIAEGKIYNNIGLEVPFKKTQGAYKNVMTESFRVHKVVFDDKDGYVLQHVEVKSIGDDAFFIGDNHSVSVLASNFHGCQSNSIYYTHDFSWSSFVYGDHIQYDTLYDDMPCRDMGIFNLESGTITQHFSLDPYSDLQGYIPPAVWVVPQFHGLC